MSDDLGTPEDPEPFDPAATGLEDGFAPFVSDRGDGEADSAEDEGAFEAESAAEVAEEWAGGALGSTEADADATDPADSAPVDPVPTSDERTGVPAADSALDRLLDLDAAPLEEHVEIFDDVHRRLHEGLAELDDEQ